MQVPAKLLTEIIAEFDCQVQSAYSGRGMFGDNCIGFVINSNSHRFCMELATFMANNKETSEALDEMMQDVRVDNMGKSIIVYFPRVQCEEEIEDDE